MERFYAAPAQVSDTTNPSEARRLPTLALILPNDPKNEETRQAASRFEYYIPTKLVLRGRYGSLSFQN